MIAFSRCCSFADWMLQSGVKLPTTNYTFILQAIRKTASVVEALKRTQRRENMSSRAAIMRKSSDLASSTPLAHLHLHVPFVLCCGLLVTGPGGVFS
jgi:hypothetical protein